MNKQLSIFYILFFIFVLWLGKCHAQVAPFYSITCPDSAFTGDRIPVKLVTNQPGKTYGLHTYDKRGEWDIFLKLPEIKDSLTYSFYFPWLLDNGSKFSIVFAIDDPTAFVGYRIFRTCVVIAKTIPVVNVKRKPKNVVNIFSLNRNLKGQLCH